MATSLRPFRDARVEAVFHGYPTKRRADLMGLRELILDTGENLPQVGDLTETLKWGQPAYLPARPRIGSTVRIDILKRDVDRYALFFHCQTTLVAEFTELYADRLAYEGNRAVLLRHGEPLPQDILRHCVGRALTYHLKSKRPSV